VDIIIGVAPKSFTGVDLWFRPDVYLPMMTAAVAPDGSDTLTHRSYRGCDLLGRLKPGVTLAQAQAEMNVIMSGLERQYPEDNKDTIAILRNEMSRRLQNGPTAALAGILVGLVVLVLMMACVNVVGWQRAEAALERHSIWRSSSGSRFCRKPTLIVCQKSARRSPESHSFSGLVCTELY
jgi:hypothetical protein